jgi:hypothetical protein
VDFVVLDPLASPHQMALALDRLARLFLDLFLLVVQNILVWSYGTFCRHVANIHEHVF